MKVPFFAWAVFAALVISLAPFSMVRSDQPPRAVNARPADDKASLPASSQAGAPANYVDPLAGQVAPDQGTLPNPALSASAVAGTLPAPTQSIRAWEQRWAVAMVLLFAALGLLGVEFVHRLQRGYLDSP